jgi:uncharacterized protein YjaG (DUF416 family)
MNGNQPLLKFDRDRCKATLDRLPATLRAAFAVACAERQFKVYVGYTERTREGDPRVLRTTLDALWQDVVDEKLTRAQLQALEKLEKRCEALIPDPERIIDRYEQNAEDAVVATIYAATARATGESIDAARAASRAIDSLWNYLTSALDRVPLIDICHPRAVDLADAHPIMQAECRRQETDLAELTDAIRKTESLSLLIDDLRRRAQADSEEFLPI